MKVYVVNLKKDTAKRRFMEEQLRAAGVEAEFADGVLGAELPPAAYRRALNRFRWWCAVGRPAAPAEVGCALAHFAIYRGMQAPVCILEDDVRLDPRFAATLARVEAFLDPDRPQLFLLSNHHHLVPDELGEAIRRDRWGMCTDGYVLTPRAAACLLKWNDPLQAPCDSWGRWARAHAEFELYHVFPSVVSQAQELLGSSTSEGRRAVSDFSWPKWVLHKGLRAVGRTVDAVLTKMGR